MERKSAHTAKQIYLSALAACLVAALAIAIALTGCGGRAGSAGAADRLAPLEEEVAFLRPAPAAAAFLAGAGEAALEERTALICYAPWEGWESAFPGRSVEATEFQLDGSGGWDGFFPFAIQGEWVYGTRSDHSYFPKTAVWRLNQTTGRGQQLLSSDQFTYLIPPDTPAYSDSNTVAITLSALSEERLFFTVSLGIGMGPGQRRLYSCNLQGAPSLRFSRGGGGGQPLEHLGRAVSADRRGPLLLCRPRRGGGLRPGAQPLPRHHPPALRPEKWGGGPPFGGRLCTHPARRPGLLLPKSGEGAGPVGAAGRGGVGDPAR